MNYNTENVQEANDLKPDTPPPEPYRNVCKIGAVLVYAVNVFLHGAVSLSACCRTCE